MSDPALWSHQYTSGQSSTDFAFPSDAQWFQAVGPGTVVLEMAGGVTFTRTCVGGEVYPGTYLSLTSTTCTYVVLGNGPIPPAVAPGVNAATAAVAGSSIMSVAPAVAASPIAVGVAGLAFRPQGAQPGEVELAQSTPAALAVRHLGPWSASVQWRYLGSGALTEDNSVRSTSSLTTNLRLGWTSPDHRYGAALYANNLFDKQYVRSIGGQGVSVLGTPVGTITPPRQWGLEFSARF